MEVARFDVAIIGGGPAGSTAGTLLRKYNPKARVVILEKEKFPREHVGESQLPPIGPILEEMGVWDKVEAANFPIKIGATYRWGQSDQLWDFEFVPPSQFRDEPRPAKRQGFRRLTAFQVDRAVFDEILLDHAAEYGCEVREETTVREVLREGDRVAGLEVERHGKVERIEAAHYLDCSGDNAVLRRAFGVEIEAPTKLKNMAMWDYWENAKWAVEIGVGGTRVQVISVDYGWLWFIPLSPTRTSLGLIVPIEYYKKSGKSAEELYERAIQDAPRISELIQGATREGVVRKTRDWSYIAEKLTGENWFLVGQSAGFSDPILAAGMTLAHSGARHVAYILLEAMKPAGEARLDIGWLKRHYDESQRKRIQQYIRFAEYWYAANGQFPNLREFAADIAKSSGLNLNPAQAFRWLSFGGFNHDDFLGPGVATLDVMAVKEVTKLFSGGTEQVWEINKCSRFRLNLIGARKDQVPVFHMGKITKAGCYVRGAASIPFAGFFRVVCELLQQPLSATQLMQAIKHRYETKAKMTGMKPADFLGQVLSTLETMLVDGWVTGIDDPAERKLSFQPKDYLESNLHWNRDDVKSGRLGALSKTDEF